MKSIKSLDEIDGDAETVIAALRQRSKEMLYEKAYAWVEKARNAGK